MNKIKIIFIFLYVLSFSNNSHSEAVSIHQIDIGKEGEEHLVMLSNGNVVRIDNGNIQLLKYFQSKANKQILLTLDAQRSKYIPTYLDSIETVYELFKEQRSDFKEVGQCYNVAHVWAYEAYKKDSLKSMKMFIFFSPKYIRKYKFKWWFHVAPMVYVKGSGQIQSYILDKQYTHTPMNIEAWKNHFILDQHPCKFIKKYSDYKNNKKDYCFLLSTSMYFWQPKDILKRDQSRYEKYQFFSGEIKHAYKQAF